LQLVWRLWNTAAIQHGDAFALDASVEKDQVAFMIVDQIEQ